MTKSIQPYFRPGAKIAIVGEAPGKQDANLGFPFLGASGKELIAQLFDAGLIIEEPKSGPFSLLKWWKQTSFHVTTVFLEQPPGNKLDSWCSNKTEASKHLGSSYKFPPIKAGKYLHPKKLTCLERLRAELDQIKPNIVIALGATACWALLGNHKITTLRGTIIESSLLPGLKVLPTYHPSYILRRWHDRPVVIADLMKAKKEAETSEITRPKRTIYIAETSEDLEQFEINLMECDFLSIDIETKLSQITSISFSPDKYSSYVIPIWNELEPDFSYWRIFRLEAYAWRVIKRILESPIPKLAQNGLYDVQYLYSTIGIKTQGFYYDSMILAHSIQPELKKGLGFLGSIYTNEPSWKSMRTSHDTETKKDA